MDYFYVGTYNGSNGLIDLYLPLTYSIEKLTFKLIPHYFMAAAKVSTRNSMGAWEGLSGTLGTEIDFSVGYQVSKAST